MEGVSKMNRILELSESLEIALCNYKCDCPDITIDMIIREAEELIRFIKGRSSP
jgi:hypothetical protein